MEVNNLFLSWLMHEGNMDGICLWSWLKVRYESTSKLDHIKRIYRENIWWLNMKADGSLVKYID